jgi:hypothetical protein
MVTQEKYITTGKRLIRALQNSGIGYAVKLSRQPFIRYQSGKYIVYEVRLNSGIHKFHINVTNEKEAIMWENPYRQHISELKE